MVQDKILQIETNENKKDDKIFVAGHNGLVGSAILRKLKKKRL